MDDPDNEAAQGRVKLDEQMKRLQDLESRLNTITWPILRDYANFYAACPDYVAARGMRQLAAPWGNDKKVISGESGAVTMGLLTMLMESWELEEEKVMMGLNEESVILLFNTEGDTDPASYHGSYTMEHMPLRRNGGDNAWNDHKCI